MANLLTDIRSAIDRVHPLYKLALVAVTVLGFGATLGVRTKDYVTLPLRVEAIEVAHDSLRLDYGHRFDRMQEQLDKIEADAVMTRCINVAQVERTNPIRCIRQ